MAPRTRGKCQICKDTESKYSCPKCLILYCSLACYKNHKEGACATSANVPSETLPEAPIPYVEPALAATDATSNDPDAFPEAQTLRPLTSLNWPYVPDETAFPDPLKRDDPKPLMLRQYEAIGTSPTLPLIRSPCTDCGRNQRRPPQSGTSLWHTRS